MLSWDNNWVVIFSSNTYFACSICVNSFFNSFIVFIWDSLYFCVSNSNKFVELSFCSQYKTFSFDSIKFVSFFLTLFFTFIRFCSIFSIALFAISNRSFRSFKRPLSMLLFLSYSIILDFVIFNIISRSWISFWIWNNSKRYNSVLFFN